MWSASTAASSPTPDRKAAAVHRLAARIQYRDIDPAEIDAVAGGPDHRTDALLAKVETGQRRGDARRVGQHRTGGRVVGQLEAVSFDIRVHHVEEVHIAGIPVRESFGETRGDIEHAVARRLNFSQ